MYIPLYWFENLENQKKVRGILDEHLIDTRMEVEKARQKLIKLGEVKILEMLDEGILKIN